LEGELKNTKDMGESVMKVIRGGLFYVEEIKKSREYIVNS